ncbi:PREDICTED: interleukin-12 subunit beta-like, partial [Nanorana parkeri]|uniref:interleukin-12 subunit beta-like n=1 Tax=Nanorana parkeri TaxID=125878 RepID=UPI000854BBC2
MFLQQIFGLALFLGGFPRLQALPESWPEHYLFGTRGSDVTITCPLEGDNVRWDRTTPLPPTFNLRDAGGYTCTDVQNSKATVHVLVQGRSSLTVKCAADSYCSHELRCSIDHQFVREVLIRAKAYKFSDSSLTVKCAADSYCSHELRCSIDHQFVREVLIRAKAYKWNNTENSSPWKQSSQRDGPAHFTVPIASVFCPFEEYTNFFRVRAEVMTEKEYWMVDMPISMTEVVVPSAPENLEVKGDHITWGYPSSWARPSSFFPLLFQVEFRKRNNVKESKMLKEMTYRKENIREFRVRCRDLYSPSSPWSAWSRTFNPLDPKGSS